MLNAPAYFDFVDPRLPATYENARTALANCVEVDECKEWANKAMAMTSYARQANDDSLFKHAQRIRRRRLVDAASYWGSSARVGSKAGKKKKWWGQSYRFAARGRRCSDVQGPTSHQFELFAPTFSR